MSLSSKMDVVVNDKATLNTMLMDKISAGNKVNMKFLASYASYMHDIEPEDFNICPYY